MSDYTPVFPDGRDITLNAGAAVTGGRLLAVTGTNTVQETSGATGAWVGVAATDTPSGARVAVKSGGVQELAVAAAVAGGDPVMAASGGRVTPFTGTNYAQVVGVALTAQTAVGQTCRVKMAR